MVEPWKGLFFPATTAATSAILHAVFPSSGHYPRRFILTFVESDRVTLHRLLPPPPPSPLLLPVPRLLRQLLFPDILTVSRVTNESSRSLDDVSVGDLASFYEIIVVSRPSQRDGTRSDLIFHGLRFVSVSPFRSSSSSCFFSVCCSFIIL